MPRLAAGVSMQISEEALGQMCILGIKCQLKEVRVYKRFFFLDLNLYTGW